MANLRTNNLSGEQGQNAYRGSVFFHGGGQLDVTSNSDFAVGTGAYTAEVWFLSGLNSGENSIFGTFTASNFGFGMWHNANNLYFEERQNSYSGDNPRITYDKFEEGYWYHLAMCRDSSSGTLRAYVNGVQIGSTTSNLRTIAGTAPTIGKNNAAANQCNGYISNIRFSNTELYPSGTTFTPPTSELTADASTILLACQNSDVPTQEETGKTLTNSSLLSGQPKVIPPYGVDAGNTFGGPIQQSSQGYMYFPTGRTEERGRGRAIWGGGSASPNEQDVMDYLQITSSGNAIDFGNLSDSRNEVRACGSSTRGVWAGGRSPHPSVTDRIDFVEIPTTANAVDFGNLTVARAAVAAVSNSTRGCFMAGFAPSNSNHIDFITIASLGDATDFGDMLGTYQAQARAMSPTRGLAAGNYGASNLIEFITIATTGNSTDFGDRTVAAYSASGTSDNTRGVFTGGDGTPNTTNVIDFVTMASAGNATDFGDLVTANGSSHADTSNSIVGCIGGGASNTNAIEKIIIQTTGNAVDYGDLSVGRSQLGATSDSHGGLS
jgi:hypothetical protein